MLKTIAGLQGVTVLSKDAQKKITGRGTCGVYLEGMGGWVQGASLEQVNSAREHFPGLRWCCDSCYWNQPGYQAGGGGGQLQALVN